MKPSEVTQSQTIFLCLCGVSLFKQRMSKTKIDHKNYILIFETIDMCTVSKVKKNNLKHIKFDKQ